MITYRKGPVVTLHDALSSLPVPTSDAGGAPYATGLDSARRAEPADLRVVPTDTISGPLDLYVRQAGTWYLADTLSADDVVTARIWRVEMSPHTERVALAAAEVSGTVTAELALLETP